MKRFAAFVTACLVGLACMLASPAWSADKGGGIPEVVPEKHDFGWNRTAFYFGVLAGYGAQNVGVQGVNLGDADLQGGVAAGFNYRASPGLVVGIEGDLMLSQVKASTSLLGATISASNQYMGSIRARAGAPIGPALFYATGGLALTETKYGLSGIGGGATDKEFQFGWVAGLGLELEVSQALALRGEVLHYAFEDYKPFGAGVDASNEQTVFRAGLIIKLN
jgi:outer membrane immunogenic protein